jgi:outer membrane protein assembly factor BamB
MIPNRMVRSVSALAFLTLTAVSAEDWYRWRGPDLNGISKETGWSTSWPNEGPKRLWKANVGTGFSSISVSHGRAYTVGNRNERDTIYCFDANTGAEIWKNTYPAPLDDHYYDGGPSATPTVDGDKVYHLARRGGLFCLDAATGNVLWSKNLHGELGVKIPEWGFASSPLVEGELLILNVGNAGAAINKTTGAVVWASGKGSAGYSSAVPFSVGTERYAVLFLRESVAAVNVKTGKELWRQTWKTSYDVNAADPIISGNEIFISSGYNKGAALLRILSNQPNVVWQNKNMRNHYNSCVKAPVLKQLDPGERRTEQNIERLPVARLAQRGGQPLGRVPEKGDHRHARKHAAGLENQSRVEMADDGSFHLCQLFAHLLFTPEKGQGGGVVTEQQHALPWLQRSERVANQREVLVPQFPPAVLLPFQGLRLVNRQRHQR